MSKQKETHFGYQKVDEEVKQGLVNGVFDSVANKYDIMNDLMSLGLHRIWKRFTILQSGVKAGDQVLDIAGGTGDLTKAFAKAVGQQGKVILADINFSMLNVGRDRLIDSAITNVDYVQANAEALPFQDNYFNVITIAFGLRNVTHIDKALASMYACLKPGGTLLVLEFSKPYEMLKPMYDSYSFNILPKLGKLIANDSESYQYLAESIRMHPGQEQLKEMMLKAQFDKVDYYNLSAGIVALHKAIKY